MNIRIKQSIKTFLIAALVLLAINIAGHFYFHRFDMTEGKRFTLTPATRQLLSELDDYVHFRIYLEGDFPAGFKRLRNQTREMLDEFQAYSPYVTYEFINPTVKGDVEATDELYDMLLNAGLQPTQLQVQTEDGSSQQVVFPGILAGYRGRELPVSLLKEQMGQSSDQVINSSVQALEYHLISAVYRLISNQKPMIGFTEANDEFVLRDVADITFALGEYYDVRRIGINGDINALDSVSTLVIAQPLTAFTEADKFVIDQFIMNGGSVLWLVDPVYASMDSLQVASETLGMAWPLNLEDMLFRYGVRINNDLVMDMQAAPIPVTTGFMGDRPQISMIPWFYFPLLSPASAHPIVRNLNAVRSEFVSSVDTVGAPGVVKIPLLQTSGYSRVVQTPARISFDIMEKQADPAQYQEGPITTAVLLEGEFNSVFRNRAIPLDSVPAGFSARETSVPTAMIIVGDGDIIRNQFDNQGNPLPLGYDRYLNQNFGNADFIFSAIDYLNDDAGIMTARNRDVKLRLLDMNRVGNDKVMIQIVNVVLPLVILLIFAILRFWWRVRKYAHA